jgi:hypothetical protein
VAAAVKAPSRSAVAALQAGRSSSSFGAANNSSFADWLQAHLLEFDDVVNPSKSLPSLPDSDVFHHIKTSRPPFSSKFHRLDGESGQEGV